jgi:hypothetical protein
MPTSLIATSPSRRLGGARFWGNGFGREVGREFGRAVQGELMQPQELPLAFCKQIGNVDAAIVQPD